MEQRPVPEGAERYYMDPPIQLIGIPRVQEVRPADGRGPAQLMLRMEPIQLYQLSLIDKFHYMTGLGFYFSKWTLIGLLRLAGVFISFAFRTLYWSFSLLGRGANAFYNTLANVPQPQLEDDEELAVEQVE